MEAEGTPFQKGHFNCPSSLAQFTLTGPPGEFKRHRLARFAPLWEVRTSHWMNPVSFITRGSRHHCETKQNWKKKSHNTWTAHLHNLIYTPALLPPAEAGMLDQFVIQQPHHSKPLSTLALSYPNPVLRLLKVHAAAHPSVCPYPNFGFRHTNPSSPLSQWSSSIIFPRDKAQL